MISNLKILTITFLIVLILPCYAYAKELPQQYNVSVNKVWNINFNTEIDSKTLDGNITITDSDGNLFDFILALSNDYKTVTVTPKTQYTPYKTYKITISKNIKSLKGSSMSEDVTETFSTQSNEAILAHLPPDNWNPFTATDEELAYYGYPARPSDTGLLNTWKETASGGWYDPASGTIPMHNDFGIPNRIVWNKQVYAVDGRCGPISEKKLGQSDGGDVYEIPGVNSAYGIILRLGDKEGHRCTRVNYTASDALSMLFLDKDFISQNVGSLQFPQSAIKIGASVKLQRDGSGKIIPVELETKIDESNSPTYIITLTESWNTKDYYYDGCAQPVGEHYWRFIVTPNSSNYLDQGGDISPQVN